MAELTPSREKESGKLKGAAWPHGVTMPFLGNARVLFRGWATWSFHVGSSRPMYGAERAKTLPLPANSSKMRAVTETYRVIAAERNPQALQQAAHTPNQLNQ